MKRLRTKTPPCPAERLDLSPYALQHLALAPPPDAEACGRGARLNLAESPLVWLARRKGRDGAPLIGPEQLQAGERLRADFTRAQMMPRVTANWSAPVAQSRRGPGALDPSDAVIAAREQVHRALDAAGPEFAGLLLDVCCFLKPLETIERERGWPARAAKVVLQLGLDRLARHYGLARAARGRDRVPMRAWSAPPDRLDAASG
ncbi:MAG TPA: DUF6456 domain-containing protein [Xanthobacteraceae bacterium]|nr:DUF6456 domain-containing protein [Xanthobacteraceae bacterium]